MHPFPPLSLYLGAIPGLNALSSKRVCTSVCAAAFGGSCTPGSQPEQTDILFWSFCASRFPLSGSITLAVLTAPREQEVLEGLASQTPALHTPRRVRPHRLTYCVPSFSITL